MAETVKIDRKQIQLTINRLTQKQYEELSASGELTQLSDQLFMTDDDSEESKKAVVNVNPMFDTGTSIATIAVDGNEKTIKIPDYYPVLIGGNHISGNNDISVLNVGKLIAANPLQEENALDDKSLIMTSENSSYNVRYSQLKDDIENSVNQHIINEIQEYYGIQTTLDWAAGITISSNESVSCEQVPYDCRMIVRDPTADSGYRVRKVVIDDIDVTIHGQRMLTIPANYNNTVGDVFDVIYDIAANQKLSSYGVNQATIVPFMYGKKTMPTNLSSFELSSLDNELFTVESALYIPTNSGNMPNDLNYNRQYYTYLSSWSKIDEHKWNSIEWCGLRDYVTSIGAKMHFNGITGALLIKAKQNIIFDCNLFNTITSYQGTPLKEFTTEQVDFKYKVTNDPIIRPDQIISQVSTSTKCIVSKNAYVAFKFMIGTYNGGEIPDEYKWTPNQMFRLVSAASSPFYVSA